MSRFTLLLENPHGEQAKQVECRCDCNSSEYLINVLGVRDAITHDPPQAPEELPDLSTISEAFRLMQWAYVNQALFMDGKVTKDLGPGCGSGEKVKRKRK